MEYIKNLASNGDINNDDINSFYKDLQSARRKMFSSKITPDQRKAASDKAKSTTAKSKVDADKYMAANRKKGAQKDAENKERKNNNLLPFTVSPKSSDAPNGKYYRYSHTTSGDYRVYKLKPEYENKPVPNNIAVFYWKQYSGDVAR
jgi:hypothetical protein